MESLHPDTERRVQQKATDIRTLVDNGDMNNAILSYHDYIRTIRQNSSASASSELSNSIPSSSGMLISALE